MNKTIEVNPKIVPELDPAFVPAVLWNRAYRKMVAESGGKRKVAIRLEQGLDAASVFRTEVLPENHPSAELTRKYVERIVKFLLWQRGGWKIQIAGAPEIAKHIAGIYSSTGARAFDSNLIGTLVYGQPIKVEAVDSVADVDESAGHVSLGRHLDGCRIGFDLGGSDRKCAAVIDGKMVHSEEVPWNPYFEKDPRYHWDGIQDSLKRAAAKMPRVDTIGGSAAGIYVNNEVRVASLFRGVPRDVFDTKVRKMFIEIGKEWGVPLQVVNDGEVTALAGSMAEGVNSLLGIAMGTSEAAGYVTPQGSITSWLNELAFTPIDYRENAPVDEWSGDGGCGVQYFSQQGIGRLCESAGLGLPADMPLPDKLVEVQKLMKADDVRARKIYETTGVYLGYALATYAEYYEYENLLLLGRVMSGKGGDIIIEKAKHVLDVEFPEIASSLTIRVPDEHQKRHGQAVAAASVPALS